MSKYGVFSGSHFSVFGRNTGKYGPEKTPYLDSFHALLEFSLKFNFILLAVKAAKILEHFINFEEKFNL